MESPNERNIWTNLQWENTSSWWLHWGISINFPQNDLTVQSGKLNRWKSNQRNVPKVCLEKWNMKSKKIWLVATQLFVIFTLNLGVSWSNLKVAYVSNGLVEPPTRLDSMFVQERLWKFLQQTCMEDPSPVWKIHQLEICISTSKIGLRHGGLDACAGGAASQVQAAGGRRLWPRGFRGFLSTLKKEAHCSKGKGISSFQSMNFFRGYVSFILVLVGCRGCFFFFLWKAKVSSCSLGAWQVDLDGFVCRTICRTLGGSGWIYLEGIKMIEHDKEMWLDNHNLAILCDLFGMVEWPWVSDLQLGDEKVTLYHLECGIILLYLLVFSWWWWHAFWWFCFFILHHRNISNSIRKTLHLGEMWDMINDSSRCNKLHSCTQRIYQIPLKSCGKPAFPATFWHETPPELTAEKARPETLEV